MKKHFIFALIFVLSFLSLELFINESNVLANEFYEFDSPNAGTFRDYIMMLDPKTGNIPFERFPIAQQETKQLQAKYRSINSISWSQVPCDMGGRTKAFAVDPNDVTHKKVWAGTATGGLWYNNDITDANSSWMPAGDVWQSLSISSICFDPNNPQIMYVGTGESETAITNIYRESSGRGYGIWKSTDGGQSFTRLSSASGFAYISDIAIKDEGGNSVIYAGVLSGLYRGGIFTSNPSNGLYRSTDGGSSWTQVLPDIQGSTVPYSPSDIEITVSGKIFVGTKRNVDGRGGACILSSTTGLSGSWMVDRQFQSAILSSSEYNIPARVKLASAPSNSNVVYAIIAAKSNSTLLAGFPTTHGKYVVKSNDGGNTWQYKSNPIVFGQNYAYLAWHAFSITVSPSDENKLFVGGLDAHLSNNGGQTWQKISDWTAMYSGGSANYVHGDIHKFTFLDNSEKLTIVTDGGVFYTSNANTTDIIFEDRNKSFATLQFYSIAISEGMNDDYMGGLQDNGTLLYKNHPLVEGDMIKGGDGAFCAFDKDTPNLLVATTYNNSFSVYDLVSGYYERADLDSGSFITTFDYDSQNNVIWSNNCDEHGVGANQLAKIYDITSGIQSQIINIGTNVTVPFSAVRLIDGNTILLGTADGKLFRVNNLNASPFSTQIDQDVLPTGYISAIQTQNNGNTILVTMSNYGIQSVWQTTDGGNNWRNVSGNLPDMPIRWAIYHPQNINRVMLATEVGVWVCDDINATNVIWTPQNNGLPKVRVDMLAIRSRDNTIVAGTHGRAMFTTLWSDVSDVSTEENDQIKIFPNPTSDFIKIVGKEINGKIYQITDLSGKIVLEGMISDIDRIDIRSLVKGIYLIKVNIKENQLIKRIIVQ